MSIHNQKTMIFVVVGYISKDSGIFMIQTLLISIQKKYNFVGRIKNYALRN